MQLHFDTNFVQTWAPYPPLKYVTLRSDLRLSPIAKSPIKRVGPRVATAIHRPSEKATATADASHLRRTWEGFERGVDASRATNGAHIGTSANVSVLFSTSRLYV
jgi:hypothetical protein